MTPAPTTWRRGDGFWVERPDTLVGDRSTLAPVTEHTLQCMEVWGGNRAVDSGVVMPGLDAWVFSRPYIGASARGSVEDTSRGGDIHYVTCCATGRITRLVVADVSGHGEKVADTAVELRRLLGRFSNYLDQERVVCEIDRCFGRLGETDARHSGLFATAVVATYWSPTEELTICNAGHPRPLRNSAATGRWELLVPPEPAATAGPSNLPLGIGLDAAHPQMTVRLRRGDLVLFYTDSLIEAARPTGEQLGEQGLLRLVGTINAAEPSALIRTLLAAVGRWRGGAEGPDLPEFADDVTVVLIRTNALGPRPSIVLDLLAVWRLVSNFVRSLIRRDTVASWPQARREVIAGTVLGGGKSRKNDTAR